MALARNRKLFVFDMDSTLIDQEVIDLLAAKANQGQEVSQITELAMAGEIDFDESLRRRVALLTGLPERVLGEVRDELTLTNGAHELIEELSKREDVVAVVSGGFTHVIAPLLTSLGIRHFRANRLEISQGHLTGKVLSPIINRSAKAAALAEFANLEGIALSQTVAVGDGANDIDMLQKAEIGIAFCARPALKQVADYVIEERNLLEVLRFI